MKRRLLLVFIWVCFGLQMTTLATRHYNPHYVILQCDQGGYGLQLREGPWGINRLQSFKRYATIAEAQADADYLTAWVKAGEPKDPNISYDTTADEGAECKWTEIDQ
jgi:hypothetical protein